MTVPSDLRDMEFDRLTVIGVADPRGRKGRWWACRCKCGNTSEARTDHLLGGRVVSCGCYLKTKAITHGKTIGRRPSPAYRIWHNMITRCTLPCHKSYKDYGGRGIQVCNRWLTFANFLDDVGERPSPGHSLDRFPNQNGNYELGNVRWATKAEQLRNMRSNVWLTFDGRTQILADWARQVGRHPAVLRYRIKRGWPVEKVLT